MVATGRLRSLISCLASASLMPVRSGTLSAAAAVLTPRWMVRPCLTVAPAGGAWLVTASGAAPATCSTKVTGSSPMRLSTWAASSCRIPTTSGNLTSATVK